jgi:hypothetical protein
VKLGRSWANLKVNGIAGFHALPDKGNNILCVTIKGVKVGNSVATEERPVHPDKYSAIQYSNAESNLDIAR